MRKPAPPIRWDSGYWYAVPCAFDGRGNRKPAVSPPEWCATYGVVGGTHYALLRTPDPWTEAPDFDVTPEEIIAAAQAGGFHPAGLNTKPGGMRTVSGTDGDVLR